jgi:SAM-dependent methyltransferase
MTDAAGCTKEPAASTATTQYAERLQRLSGQRWKRIFDVQAPYRWNVGRLGLGYTLDVGCGIGRNLAHLGGNGVGVDHNAEAIAVARARGLKAYTVDEFLKSDCAVPNSFDSLLVAHVVEHMGQDEAVAMLECYLPYLKLEGLVCLITPQEAGYRSDSTHIRFVDFAGAAALSERLGLRVARQYSFPLPRVMGKIFRYNEFIQVSRLARPAR